MGVQDFVEVKALRCLGEPQTLARQRCLDAAMRNAFERIGDGQERQSAVGAFKGCDGSRYRRTID